MALQQRIETVEQAAPNLSAWTDDPLPLLIQREYDELNRRELALPARSAARARLLIVSAIVGGATAWGLLIGAANLALKLIA